jgi:hypothetical protein
MVYYYLGFFEYWRDTLYYSFIQVTDYCFKRSLSIKGLYLTEKFGQNPVDLIFILYRYETNCKGQDVPDVLVYPCYKQLIHVELVRILFLVNKSQEYARFIVPLEQLKHVSCHYKSHVLIVFILILKNCAQGFLVFYHLQVFLKLLRHLGVILEVVLIILLIFQIDFF